MPTTKSAHDLEACLTTKGQTFGEQKRQRFTDSGDRPCLPQRGHDGLPDTRKVECQVYYLPILSVAYID